MFVISDASNANDDKNASSFTNSGNAFLAITCMLTMLRALLNC